MLPDRMSVLLIQTWSTKIILIFQKNLPMVFHKHNIQNPSSKLSNAPQTHWPIYLFKIVSKNINIVYGYIKYSTLWQEHAYFQFVVIRYNNLILKNIFLLKLQDTSHLHLCTLLGYLNLKKWSCKYVDQTLAHLYRQVFTLVLFFQCSFSNSLFVNGTQIYCEPLLGIPT